MKLFAFGVNYDDQFKTSIATDRLIMFFHIVKTAGSSLLLHLKSKINPRIHFDRIVGVAMRSNEVYLLVERKTKLRRLYMLLSLTCLGLSTGRQINRRIRDLSR
jgi:hypothetical protein